MREEHQRLHCVDSDHAKSSICDIPSFQDAATFIGNTARTGVFAPVQTSSPRRCGACVIHRYANDGFEFIEAHLTTGGLVQE